MQNKLWTAGASAILTAALAFTSYGAGDKSLPDAVVVGEAPGSDSNSDSGNNIRITGKTTATKKNTTQSEGSGPSVESVTQNKAIMVTLDAQPEVIKADAAPEESEVHIVEDSVQTNNNNDNDNATVEAVPSTVEEIETAPPSTTAAPKQTTAVQGPSAAKKTTKPEVGPGVKKETPAPTTAASTTAPAATAKSSADGKDYDALRQDIVNYAKQFIGIPYVWGGTSLTKGVDCSGYTMQIYAHFGINTGRTSRTQAVTGRQIPISDVKPGDLLFYATRGRIDHVTMYIGNGKLANASSRKTGVIISDISYRQPVKAVRFLPD